MRRRHALLAGIAASLLSRAVSASELAAVHQALQSLPGSGALLLMERGAEHLALGFGEADEGLPATPDTLFDIGSITKTLTGLLVTRGMQQGLWRSEDRLDTHLPALRGSDCGVRTLQQLLTHGAGLPEQLGDDYEVLTRDSLLQRAGALRLQPADRYRYSNLGYSLLAALLETQGSYDSLLREQLLRPARLDEAGGPLYRLPSKLPRAAGYREGRRWARPDDLPWAADGPYWNLRGNGGLLASPRGLGRLLQAAFTPGQLLEADWLERFASPQLQEGEQNSHYGHGVVVMRTARDTRLLTHNGGNGAFYAEFLFDRDTERLLVFMSNRAQPALRRAPQDMWRGWHGIAKPAAVAPLEQVSRILDALLAALKQSDRRAAFVAEHMAPGLRDSVPLARHLALLDRLAAELRPRGAPVIDAGSSSLRYSALSTEPALRLRLDIGPQGLRGLQLDED